MRGWASLMMRFGSCRRSFSRPCTMGEEHNMAFAQTDNLRMVEFGDADYV